MIDDALHFAEWLTAVTTRALGEAVASVILHGSLALDDYAPVRSDIDLLVIVDRPLDSATMDELTHALVAEQSRAPTWVDLRVVTREVAARPPEPPPMDLYVRLDRSAEPDEVGTSPITSRGAAPWSALPRPRESESSTIRSGSPGSRDTMSEQPERPTGLIESDWPA